jgi:excinuclease ABC subunit A
VEHDLDVIRSADHVIDIGPGAGRNGGRVVGVGTPLELTEREASPTGRELRRRAAGHLITAARRGRTLRPGLAVAHASLHNLRDLSVDIPAGGLIAVTGVSGSGKSTLVFDLIAQALASLPARAPARLGESALPRSDQDTQFGQRFDGAGRIHETVGPARRAGQDPSVGPALSVQLHEPFARVVVANRDSIVATPASSPASIIGVAGRIRDLFAGSDEARAMGLTRKHFSAQKAGGRCEACEGAGRLRVSMDFLPDVWVQCAECQGRRYRPEILACLWHGRSIADVLGMTVADALEFFAGDALIARRMQLLEEIGLGYLALGQGADTLSGGERQRLALAADLSGDTPSPALYLFDEPTTGLHVSDVARLLQVFDRLVAAGHTLIVVEHHLDVVAAADHVIDLGPEGGAGGGRVVASGSPRDVARASGSWTGAALAKAGL